MQRCADIADLKSFLAAAMEKLPEDPITFAEVYPYPSPSHLIPLCSLPPSSPSLPFPNLFLSRSLDLTTMAWQAAELLQLTVAELTEKVCMH